MPLVLPFFKAQNRPPSPVVAKPGFSYSLFLNLGASATTWSNNIHVLTGRSPLKKSCLFWEDAYANGEPYGDGLTTRGSKVTVEGSGVEVVVDTESSVPLSWFSCIMAAFLLAGLVDCAFVVLILSPLDCAIGPYSEYPSGPLLVTGVTS